MSSRCRGQLPCLLDQPFHPRPRALPPGLLRESLLRHSHPRHDRLHGPVRIPRRVAPPDPAAAPQSSHPRTAGEKMSRTSPSQQQQYVRFSLSDRIEHLLLLVSFTVLVLTGIPQKFAPAGWAELAIRVLGGIETVRIVHRIAAVILIIESIYHIAATGYKLLVLRARPAMLPRPKDFVDFFQALAFNLGLSDRRPRYDRYNFEEKLEYWAVVWGTMIMVVTGFILWNPISASRFLPGQFIPAAKAAHGGEAVLAALAIIVWHVYNVHIKTFNRSMFTGKLTREEMEHEHALELELIESGQLPPPPPPHVLRRRRLLYLPFAAVFTLALTVVLFIFVTYEETAIATIPPEPESVPVFVRASPLPTPTLDLETLYEHRRQAAGSIPHAIAEGRDDCLACHDLGKIRPFTPIHAEFQLRNDICQECHRLATEQMHLLPTVAFVEVPSFSRDILPALQAHCAECHGPEAEVTLMSYEALLNGGKRGPLVVPGDADSSRLILVQSMPPAAHPTRLPREVLELIYTWIQAGAPEN
ncbi:MAG: hypothetical protein D6775_11710 [Caldilineae bacterium]|nr:MAG: hypothetical protein D6775_11710 [Caldilineae bacterium]